MIFIGIASLVAIALFVERLIVLIKDRRQNQKLKSTLLDALKNNQFERASTLLDTHKCSLGILSEKVIANRNLPREAIQETINDESQQVFAKLNRFIPTVGTIASLSPLLGLLGTVTGMIQVFSRLADEYAAGATANPGMLAGGIWEALLTTAAGLCVAIPALLFHKILNNTLNSLWLSLQADITEVLNIISPTQDTPAKS